MRLRYDAESGAAEGYRYKYYADLAMNSTKR